MPKSFNMKERNPLDTIESENKIISAESSLLPIVVAEQKKKLFELQLDAWAVSKCVRPSELVELSVVWRNTRAIGEVLKTIFMYFNAERMKQLWHSLFRARFHR